MKIKPLSPKLKTYLDDHQLEKKFNKAVALFEQDYSHPSLHVEILKPKHLKIYSFRVDIKHRAVFIITGGDAEIISITAHYS